MNKNIISTSKLPLCSGLKKPRVAKIKVYKTIEQSWIPVPTSVDNNIDLFGFLNTSLLTCFHPNSSIKSSPVNLYFKLTYSVIYINIFLQSPAENV